MRYHVQNSHTGLVVDTFTNRADAEGYAFIMNRILGWASRDLFIIIQ